LLFYSQCLHLSRKLLATSSTPCLHFFCFISFLINSSFVTLIFFNSVFHLWWLFLCSTGIVMIMIFKMLNICALHKFVDRNPDSSICGKKKFKWLNNFKC
jgi:hypothetical protein